MLPRLHAVTERTSLNLFLLNTGITVLEWLKHAMDSLRDANLVICYLPV